MEKISTIFVFLLISMNFGGFPSFAEENKSQSPIKTVALHECKDQTLGLQFLCNPDWELEAHDQSMLIIISSDPAVTLTISKAKSPVIFFEQLTDTALKEMGQYVDGFTKEKVQIAGENATKVMGYSIGYPEIRLLDFYFLRDFELYSILFSVNPKEKFSDYESLFISIITSIQFLNKKGG